MAKRVLAADIAVWMAEALGHRGRQVIRGLGHPRARADGIFVRRGCCFRLAALLQGASGAHDQLAEFDDAEVGRPEMLARAILDRALAVLNCRILLRYAGNAGQGPALLPRSVAQLVISLVPPPPSLT